MKRQRIYTNARLKLQRKFSAIITNILSVC